MRRLPLALFLLAAAASAQPSLPDPGPLLEALGMPWAEAEARLPAPSWGEVVDGRGLLRWYVGMEGLADVSAKVVDGRLALVRVEWEPGALGDLKRMQRMIRDRVGPPEAGAYYSAAQVGEMPGDAPPMEVGFWVRERAVYFRAAPE